MEYFVHIDARDIRVEVDKKGVRVDGDRIDIELASNGGSPVRSVRIAGRSLRVIPSRNGRGNWTLDIDGHSHRVQVLDAGQEAIRRARKAAGGDSGPRALRAPMPGLVVRIEARVGEIVQAGEGIIIVEAMKMENELCAERSAKVTAVLVEEGATVEKDQVLVEFEALETES